MQTMLMFSFFALFFLCNDVSSNQTESPGDISNTTLGPDYCGSSTTEIRDLEFFQVLRNPCNVRWEVPGTFVPLPNFFRELNDQIEPIKNRVRPMVPGIFKGCTTDLQLNEVSETIAHEALKEMEEGAAFNKIYRSIIFHSAYSYIIYHALNATSDPCQTNVKIIEDASKVATDLKTIACVVFYQMNSTRYDSDDIIPALINYACTALDCGKLFIFGCQIMGSVLNMLNEIENYGVARTVSHNFSSTLSTANFSSVSIQAT